MFILCIDKTSHPQSHQHRWNHWTFFITVAQNASVSCFRNVKFCFSLLCSYGRHPFKMSCLHVIHRKLFTSTFIQTQPHGITANLSALQTIQKHLWEATEERKPSFTSGYHFLFVIGLGFNWTMKRTTEMLHYNMEQQRYWYVNG